MSIASQCLQRKTEMPNNNEPNNLVAILSHCNTEKKLRALKSNLNKLKCLGLKTILASHCPVSPDIQKLVNYFVYDDSNPLLHLIDENRKALPKKDRKCVVHHLTCELGGSEIRINSFVPDAGWCVFNQIAKCVDLSNSIDYDYFSIINYDLELTPSLLRRLINPNLKEDALLSSSAHQSELDNYTPVITEDSEPTFSNVNTEGLGGGPSLIFSILKKEAILKVRKNIKKEDYLSDKSLFAEGYWGSLLKGLDLSFINEKAVGSITGDEHTQDFYDQVPSDCKLSDNQFFKIFFEDRKAAFANKRAFIYDVKPGKVLKFKVNNSRVIEVDSDHLEDYVDRIEYIREDGSLYSFEKEMEEATKFMNCIHLDGRGQ